MTIDKKFQKEIIDDLDHLGEKIKKSNIKAKVVLDAYKIVRKILN